MGKRYVQHSDMCGCERCAVQWDRENPLPVFDAVDDPDVLDCGCDAWRGCDCYDYDPGYDGPDEDEIAERVSL
jgi:hypothetical protein